VMASDAHARAKLAHAERNAYEALYAKVTNHGLPDDLVSSVLKPLPPAFGEFGPTDLEGLKGWPEGFPSNEAS